MIALLFQFSKCGFAAHAEAGNDKSLKAVTGWKFDKRMDVAQHIVLCWTCLSQAKQGWTETVIKKMVCGKAFICCQGLGLFGACP